MGLVPLVFVACSSSGGAGNAEDCDQAEGLCAVVDAAPASDGKAASVMDGAQVVDAKEAEVTDASFCQESLDAWCAMPFTGCIRDWASAVHTLPDQGCAGWSVSVCGGYDVLSWMGTDGRADEYYDQMSGQLVAIVNTGYFQPCVGGPADFVPPSACSSSMPLCDLLGDAGTDASSDAVDPDGQ